MRRLTRWRVVSVTIFTVLVILYGLVSAFLANGVTKTERSEFSHLPEEYGLPFNNVEFISRGGSLTLKGWHITNPHHNRTIIFVHGLGSNRAGDDALDLGSRLWENGFNLLMFDLRGHGLSDSGRTSGGYFEQNDVLGAFDFVQSMGTDSKNIGVIGFSMGAAASILSVAKEPKIRALVSDTTYAGVSDLVTQEVSRTTPLPGWIVPLFNPGTTLAADLLYKIKIEEMTPEIAVTDISYPILLIHGMSDTRIPLQHSIRVHKAAHPSSTLWQVPDVEHVDAFKTHPDEYTRRVTSYFEAHLGIKD